MQLIFAVFAALAVFLLVPRGVSLGEITVQTEHRTWNFSQHSYQLNLMTQIPVNNPNYLSVSPCWRSSAHGGKGKTHEF